MGHVEECSGGVLEEESVSDNCCPCSQESFSNSEEVLEHIEKQKWKKVVSTIITIKNMKKNAVLYFESS